MILEHREDFALLESMDNGKPYAVAKMADVPLADGLDPTSPGAPAA
ncbi:MAG: hypothetical protein ACJ72N_13325 [Labedaea sp.]